MIVGGRWIGEYGEVFVMVLCAMLLWLFGIWLDSRRHL